MAPAQPESWTIVLTAGYGVVLVFYHGTVPERMNIPSADLPINPTELAIEEVWGRLFQLERISREANFFELGGNSLLVLDALENINSRMGCDLTVADAYLNPTIRELAICVGGGTTVDEFVDLANEAVLPESIVAPPGSCAAARVENVLLTGATGFVGRFLLAQLLQDTDATVHCLVKARTETEAFGRIKSTLVNWDLWRADFEGRVRAIQGDMREPRLGIEEGSYHELCQRIDSLFHCATSMNHLETYTMAKAANVGGTVELLRLASNARPKLLNYISTLSVFNGPAAGGVRVVNEAEPIDKELHPNSHGYVASKWVGEKLVMRAHEKGVPCNILRVGLVCGDSQSGRYDELQHDYRLLKSCLLSGYGISAYEYRNSPVPVDYAARAIVHLGTKYGAGGEAFHICSETENPARLFERCNAVADTGLELLPFYEWVQQVKRLHYAGHSLPIVPVMENVFSLDEATFYEQQRAARSGSAIIDSSRTRRILEEAGIVAPILDDDLLRLCIESMYNRDADLINETHGRVRHKLLS